MKATMTSLFASVMIASLAGMPAAAQTQTDHAVHHEGTTAQTGPGAGTTGSTAPPMQQMQTPGTGAAMQGMPMGSMMQMMPMCAMMMPGMAGMMQGMPGMRGMAMGSPMPGGMPGAANMMPAQPVGDQGPASLALSGINSRMHGEMQIVYSGNTDVDFAKSMLAHHEGAIDMARIELAFGKNPEMRKLAEEIVRAQQAEVEQITAWLKTQGQ
jgi:uncharacterized protein (DUF305 family)